MVVNEVSDRAIGAMLGLAVGDALGSTLEFSARDSQPLHTEMKGGGPFHLEPGYWTDDTITALCLAESLIATRGLDPHHVMEQLVKWWREGHNSPTGICFDIGHTTSLSLSRFLRTGDPLGGDDNPRSAGNGSLMRIAPLPIFYLHRPHLAADAAKLQSRATHAAPECLDACAYFTALMIKALREGGQADIFASTEWEGTDNVAKIAGGSWRGKARDEISSSGYVIDTLEAAIWCVANSESFEEAVIKAVNLGEDADTVGAVTGQLAGALWGAGSIPNRWLTPLYQADRLERTARNLLLAGAKAAGLQTFLRTDSRNDDWEREALENPTVIPAPLLYDGAAGIAHMIDGYRLPDQIGFGKLAVSRVMHERYTQTQAWEGSAVELWITLFINFRADRFSMAIGPEGERPEMDALAEAFRCALVEGRLWPESTDHALSYHGDGGYF